MCNNSRVKLVVPRPSKALPVGLGRYVLVMLVLISCSPFIPALWRRASDLRSKGFRNAYLLWTEEGVDTHTPDPLLGSKACAVVHNAAPRLCALACCLPPIQALTVPKSSLPVGRDKADIFRAGLAARIGAERVLGGRPRLLKDYLAYSR